MVVFDGSQSTLQPWAGGAVVSAPILVSGGQRFESSPVHFFSLLSMDKYEWEVPGRTSWGVSAVLASRSARSLPAGVAFDPGRNDRSG